MRLPYLLLLQYFDDMESSKLMLSNEDLVLIYSNVTFDLVPFFLAREGSKPLLVTVNHCEIT